MTSTLRFRLDEYDALLARGVLDERRQQRIELIYGELRELSPAGPMHEERVDRIAQWCYQNTDRSSIRVRVQNSIGLPQLDSAPQPDAALVRQQNYAELRPQAGDVLLVIEVADSSLAYDRSEKADIYAAAGIHDYWIIIAVDWTVEVHRDPSLNGYRILRSYAGGEKVSPLALPEISLDVSALFQH